MTHTQMMQFRKYQMATAASQTMALTVAQFAEREFGATPVETTNGYLRYLTNFLLIETIHHTLTSLTIDVAGRPIAFADLAGPHVRVERGQNGYTKLYITHPDDVMAALEAVRRSWQRRNPGARPTQPQMPQQAPSAEQGLGYQRDEKIRQAVEIRALDMAEGIYRAQDYAVERMGRPYDLDCVREEPRAHRRVEVKGLQAENPTDIILTDGEVRHARHAPCPVDLLVVAGIEVHEEVGRIVATGGQVHHHIEDWVPVERDLTPTQYRYRLP